MILFLFYILVLDIFAEMLCVNIIRKFSLVSLKKIANMLIGLVTDFSGTSYNLNLLMWLYVIYLDIGQKCQNLC